MNLQQKGNSNFLILWRLASSSWFWQLFFNCNYVSVVNYIIILLASFILPKHKIFITLRERKKERERGRERVLNKPRCWSLIFLQHIFFHLKESINVRFLSSKKGSFISFNKSPLKMIKNTFYFILKLFSFLRY